jgi:hypothetical protein
MERVGEIAGEADISAGWHRFPGVRYRMDVWQERGRRRLVSGSIAADFETLAILQEFGESVIDLEWIGSFGFIVTDVDGGGIEITGPVAKPRQEDEWK